jgi:hypothetical protein
LWSMPLTQACSQKYFIVHGSVTITKHGFSIEMQNTDSPTSIAHNRKVCIMVHWNIRDHLDGIWLMPFMALRKSRFFLNLFLEYYFSFSILMSSWRNQS